MVDRKDMKTIIKAVVKSKKGKLGIHFKNR